ncbi:MAG TPA: hypothetical protein VLH77_03475 [Gammaproteobacteria bacterium]|nr:hypothetical protein [Gammaproteobacteria bacterium]
MKRVLALSLIFTALSSPTFAEAVLRDNSVVFAFIDGRLNPSTSASFIVNRHSVTEGQPSEINDNEVLPSLVGRSKMTHLLNGRPLVFTEFDIIAGRHKSSPVVDALASWGYDTRGVPAEMNFALEGTLVFTSSEGPSFTCKNVAVAQTSIGLRNRWYVFSQYPRGTSFGVEYTNIICTAKDGLNYEYQISHLNFFGIPTNRFAVADGIFVPGFVGHPFPVKKDVLQPSDINIEVRR